MTLETSLLGEFVSTHPSEAARVLESMPAPDAAEVMQQLPLDLFSELLRWLSPITAASALESLGPEGAANALSATRSDLAAAVLRTMSAEQQSAIVDRLSPDARKETGPLLRFADGTAGALMDPSVLTFAESLTAADALERVRHNSEHALYYLYVVDDAQKLVGVANIRELMAARPEQLLGSIAVRTVSSLPARASWESLLAHPGWKRFHALPVVETDGRFLGVVRYESVRKLEDQSAEHQLEDHGARTATALGELYGLGLRGLFDLAASAVLGSGEAEGRPR
ncbi:MAG TPA: CBS domain-containing protein [Polyangiales bacterium]|nr:CBS domain-containing protein [Polyangiales bacterium]